MVIMCNGVRATSYERVHKVLSVIDKFFELNRLVKSMSDEEFSLLERVLENTLEEMER